MGTILISLLGLAVLLLLISFFQKDPYTELKEEIDQLTLQQVQELYQLKRKVKILEEELLVSDDHYSESVAPVHKREIHDIIKNQVWSLAQQGKPIDQIASLSSLSIEDVYNIMDDYAKRGKQHE